LVPRRPCDIQTILWVARRHFGTLNLHAMVGQVLLDSEYALLVSSQEFLLKQLRPNSFVGFAEDRLLFRSSTKVRTLLGFEDKATTNAIDRTFYAEYYRRGDGDRPSSATWIAQHWKSRLCAGESGPSDPTNSRLGA
jgi:[protein-PII] uridylyltransferase